MSTFNIIQRSGSILPAVLGAFGGDKAKANTDLPKGCLVCCVTHLDVWQWTDVHHGSCFPSAHFEAPEMSLFYPAGNEAKNMCFSKRGNLE